MSDAGQKVYECIYNAVIAADPDQPILAALDALCEMIARMETHHALAEKVVEVVRCIDPDWLAEHMPTLAHVLAEFEALPPKEPPE